MLVRLCRGRFLKHVLCTPRGIAGQALLGLCLTTAFANAQTAQKPTTNKASAKRVNELALAGLRPGRDTLTRAIHRYGESENPLKEQGESIWDNGCRKSSLIVGYNQKQMIETISVRRMQGSIDADCFDKVKLNPWRTGHGLAINDPATKVVQLYGEPDSRSPSTRDGQPLELLHYAFDWAGQEVPQVMEVLCTREKDGQPGRVVEITLAAASL